MNLTKQQNNELECITYFKFGDWYIEPTEKEIEKYFEWSEKGLHKEKIGNMWNVKNGLQALIMCKKWRDRHIEMYEEGILEGSFSYYDLLGINNKKLVMVSVMNFLAVNMFNGIDKDLIKETYRKYVL